MDSNEWVNLGDAADFVGVHPTTMQSWADKGQIPSQRTPGGHRRFWRQDLEAWIEIQTRSQQAGTQLIMSISTDWGQIRQLAGDFTNEVLLALVEAHPCQVAQV